ncbi:protein of unknown function [Legionella fallonii LLAP-10]|uniref:Uncharacterized protein n=1 Tax=Legionella fallonii LLAP-10 TaxID=1212491 RepID=A0A098G4S5_9GAMM|nr:protein of unknown function [Legionella fallonii LLAP-10]
MRENEKNRSIKHKLILEYVFCVLDPRITAVDIGDLLLNSTYCNAKFDVLIIRDKI